MIHPIIIEKFGIYDILYNDCNEYIIITNNNAYFDIKLVVDKDTVEFIRYTTKADYDANPIIYTCKYPVYSNIITLLIDGSC